MGYTCAWCKEWRTWSDCYTSSLVPGTYCTKACCKNAIEYDRSHNKTQVTYIQSDTSHLENEIDQLSAELHILKNKLNQKNCYVFMFDYKKPIEKEINTRTILVIREDETYFQGLDLTVLDRTQRRISQEILCKKALEEPRFGDDEYEGLNEKEKTAYRVFRWDRIVRD